MSKKAIAALVAAALILTGAFLFGAAMTALDWDFTQLSTTKYETNEYTFNEEFEHLNIVTDTADVVLVPAEDTDSIITCHEQTNAHHRVAVKDGTLTVEVNNTKTWCDYIGIQFDTPKITLSIPSRTYGVLSVYTDTGDVEIPKEFTFDSVEINGRTGDVTIAAKIQETIDVAVETGNIRMQTVTANSANLSVSTGMVTVTDLSCTGDITVRASTGNTYLTCIRCHSFTSNGSTGDLYLKDLIAETITLRRNTGDVRLDGCDAAEINVITDTGDVTGYLLSEKIFITETNTGRVEVPKSTNGDLCHITTDTGDIEIRVQP